MTVEPMRSLPKIRTPRTESRRVVRLITKLLDVAEDKGQPKVVFRKHGMDIDIVHTKDGSGDLVVQFGSTEAQRFPYEVAMQVIEARIFEVATKIREYAAHQKRHEERISSALVAP